MDGERMKEGEWKGKRVSWREDTTYMYRSIPSERPPYFHARMARKRGGWINGSDQFSTRGAPPILISAPRP